MPELTDIEKQSLEEIPHPSMPEGSSIYGGTKQGLGKVDLPVI